MFTVEHGSPGGLRYCKHFCVVKVYVEKKTTVIVLCSVYADVVREQTRENFLTYIKSNRGATIKEMAFYFGLSRQTAHRHIRLLLESRRITKIGRAPIVCYVVANRKQSNTELASRGKILKYRFVTKN